MIKWSGHLLLWLGTVHLVLTLALTAPTHAADWLSGAAWGLNGSLSELPAVEGAFWVTVGSFGAPLVLCGALVLWLDRRGLTPPTFLGWGLLAWSLAGGALFEPAPWIALCIAAGLLTAGVRRAGRERPEPAPQLSA